MLTQEQLITREWQGIMRGWMEIDHFKIVSDAAISAAASEFGVAEDALRAAFGRQGKPDRPLGMIPAKLAVYRAISEVGHLPLAELPEDLKGGRCMAAAYWHRHGEASLGDPYQQKYPLVKAAVLAAWEAAT